MSGKRNTLSENQIIKIEKFQKKLPSIKTEELYERFELTIKNIEKLDQTHSRVGGLNVESWKTTLIILELMSRVKNRSDNAILIYKTWKWFDVIGNTSGTSLRDLSYFVNMLTTTPTPDWLEKCHNEIFQFMKGYKKKNKSLKKEEKLMIMSILTTFFKSVYESSLPFIDNTEIRDFVKKWKSEINDIFNISEMIVELEKKEKLEPIEKFVCQKYGRALYLLISYDDEAGSKENDKKTFLDEKTTTIFLKKYGNKYPLIALPKFLTNKIYEIDDVDTDFPYHDEVNYLISLYFNIRENVLSNKKSSYTSHTWESILISLISLAEKTYFTFMNSTFNDKETKINHRDINAISYDNWQLISSVINKDEKLNLYNVLRENFVTSCLLIFGDYKFSKNKMSDNKMLRNIIVHRNPMVYDKYSKANLINEIEYLMPLVANQIVALVKLLSLNEMRNKESAIDRQAYVIGGSTFLCAECAEIEKQKQLGNKNFVSTHIHESQKPKKSSINIINKRKK